MLKRMITAIAAGMLALSLGTPGMIIETHAEYSSYDELYPMNCSGNDYEVASLNNSGGFDKAACTADWNTAKNEMYKLGDAGVIRHRSSGSATKIINMVNGVVYSYPQRNGQNIATITQYSSSVANMKTTYVTVHREMCWKGLETWSGDSNGKVHVVLNGFDGYIDLNNVDLIPMKAVTQDIPLYLGGNDSTGLNEYPFLTHVRQAYYRVEKNGNYTDLVYHCFTGWGGGAGSSGYPAEWTFALGPAPEWMTVGETYFSDDGTTFYHDRYFSDQAGIYYPYYQFLPLRTKTKIKASSFDSYLYDRINSDDSAMAGKGQVFIDSGETYGMNALLVYAIGILESGNGRSDYARNRNNLFGIAAYDSNPDAAYSFSSVDQCIQEEMGIFLRGYTDINDYRFFGPQLGNKGSGVNVKYAGDPYWGMKIASIAYGIDKKDNNYDGNLTDFNTVSLGVIRDDQRVSILKSVNGDTLYNSAYGATYQKNHMVAVRSETGDYYQIQSTNPLQNGSVFSLSNSGLFAYNWNDAGYLPKSQVSLVNSTVIQSSGETPTDEFTVSVSASFGDNGTLAIEGQAYRPGIYVTDENNLTHTLELVDESFKTIQTVHLTTTVMNDVASFRGTVDLSTLQEGSYFLRLITSYSRLSQYSETILLDLSEAQDKSYQARTYHLKPEEGGAVLIVEPVQCESGSVYDETSGACVCMPGYENYEAGRGCSAKPAVETPDLYQMLESLAWKEENILSISGNAFFKGLNASDTDTVVHTLILSNQETGEELEFETVTDCLDTPISFADGYDYRNVHYQTDLDLSEIPDGNYALKIRVTNGDQSGSTLVISTRIDDLKDHKTDDGTLIRVYARAMANYRFEISKEKTEIDFSAISKPTRRNSVYAENSLSFEDSVLSMDGTAFIYNTNIRAEDHPVYTLLFVDETGRVISCPCEVYESSIDPAELLKLKYKLVSANFRVRQDLSSLPEGTYRMVLKIETDDALDIFELYNVRRSEDLVSVADEKEYRIESQATHSRYVLTITDQSTAH